VLWFDSIVYDDLSLSSDTNGDAILQSGQNSVNIIGVKAADIEETFNARSSQLTTDLFILFGDEFPFYQEWVNLGAFADCTSQKVFNDSKNLMLA
jgi:hypothetical protein